jgi:hypothetical protein
MGAFAMVAAATHYGPLVVGLFFLLLTLVVFGVAAVALWGPLLDNLANAERERGGVLARAVFLVTWGFVKVARAVLWVLSWIDRRDRYMWYRSTPQSRRRAAATPLIIFGAIFLLTAMVQLSKAA